ncbi:MAG: carboxypeptidase regulatory-like domain-containing protein [Gemmatimonadetes bacterium]|nr:carboxypeptidase regulatory-like domain-containing protein [Gemmatimonadota bacterium]
MSSTSQLSAVQSTSDRGFIRRMVPLGASLAIALTWSSCTLGDRMEASSVVGRAVDDAVISGVVQGRDGPEAGVWVIAETDDLETGFTKIVVSDDDGRFVLPELPEASYDVWVRGYGLADSEPLAAAPGDDLVLAANYPETPQEEASVYPASYWYSLMEVPSESDFPGTGPSGNGISTNVRSQAAWIDNLKQGCQLCHQLGNQITRETTHIEGRFASTEEAWSHRLNFGQRGPRMGMQLAAMGQERAVLEFADWTDRIMAGEVPPQPPRPHGEERNVVLTLWDWGDATSYVHDEVATDKRDPSVNAGGAVYGVSMSDDRLLIVNPGKNESRDVRVPVWDPDTESYFPTTPGFEPSPFWGDEVVLNGPANVHNPMMDQEGRVWLTSRIRNSPNNPDWCREGSSNAYAQYSPINFSGRQASVFHPDTEEFTLVDTCFGTHHLQFGEDSENTVYFSGDTRVIGWVRSSVLLDGPAGPLVDRVRDQAPARLAERAEAAQGWCPTVIDTNGDGLITKPWNSGPGPADPELDTQLTGFAYGIIVNPVDNSIWIARTGGIPGRIFRLELGDNPPQSCKTEVYEPPFENPAVPQDQWGFSPRGIDVTRDGIIWTALSGSSHLASFDRSKCAVLNGPAATGQHCPEGWTLYPAPGPQMKNAVTAGGADFHYYNWVDQFNTLGLGEDIPIANGTTSDALLALDPDSGEWVRMRVPYPMGFFSRGLDGRIDDPDAGWKGRGVWANFGTNVPWHLEGGAGTTSKIVKFQIRPGPLAY